MVYYRGMRSPRSVPPIALLLSAALLSGCGDKAPAGGAPAIPVSHDAPLPAPLQVYMDESQRWYDEELLRLQMIVKNFRESRTFKNLEEPWQKELDRHQAEGVRPMHFGRDRTIEPTGEIIHITWTFEPGRLGYVDSARIIEFGKDGVLVSVKDDPDPQKPRGRVLVKGVDLAAHREGDLVDLPGLMMVTGEATYQTGTREVPTFVLEPFDVEPFRSRVPGGMLRD